MRSVATLSAILTLTFVSQANAQNVFTADFELRRPDSNGAVVLGTIADDGPGYRYRYDKATDQYAHPSGIVVATPSGRLSRYFYGIDYPPTDLRLGLMKSSENRIGSPVDQVLLLCFHYDPATGKYGFVIAGVLRLAALATVFALGGYLTLAFYREFRQSRFQGPKSKVTGLVAAQTPDS